MQMMAPAQQGVPQLKTPCCGTLGSPSAWGLALSPRCSCCSDCCLWKRLTCALPWTRMGRTRPATELGISVCVAAMHPAHHSQACMHASVYLFQGARKLVDSPLRPPMGFVFSSTSSSSSLNASCTTVSWGNKRSRYPNESTSNGSMCLNSEQNRKEHRGKHK
jgi:hypothetical protein